MKPRYVEYTKTGLLLELKRLHSIIKEVREYLKAGKTFDNEDTRKTVEYLQNNILEILDKV